MKTSKSSFIENYKRKMSDLPESERGQPETQEGAKSRAWESQA